MNCDAAKDQLLDLLYDEISPDQRAALTQHLESCSACKAELAGYRQTLIHARSALSGPLAHEAPARVRHAVLEAAHAAVQQRPAGSAAKATRSKLGFFAKLWRTPWLLPAFGAVSVATVVLLVRVLKNPEVLPGQTPRSIPEMVQPMVEPTLAPAAPAPATQPKATPSPLSADRGEARAAEKADKTASETRLARERAAEEMRGEGLGALRGLQRSAGRSKADQAAAGEAPAKDRADNRAKKSMKGVEDGLSSIATAGAAAGADDRRRFAEPPPPRQLAEATPDLAQPARKEANRAAATRSPAPGAFPPGSTAASTPAMPPPAPAADSERAVAASRIRASGLPSPPGPQKPSLARDDGPATTAAKRETGPTVEESIHRADRLFAEQRWSAAADAYRELLRRYPGHKDNARWRGRIDQAVVAERQSAPPAAAKAAKASAPADDARE